jgi:hypothetical protein
MAARSVTSAALGALAVVLGWAAWSMFGPGDAPEPAMPADARVAQTAPPAAAPAPATAPRAVVQASAAADATPHPAPPASPRPPALRPGLVLVHDLPVAERALPGGDATAPLPLTAVALPPGVQPGDAVINRAGMVALTHSGAAPAAGEAPRLATSASAP